MKRLSFLLVLFISIRLQAAEPTKVTSEIKQATVYLKGAVLKNKATANVPAGRSTLLFTGLSYSMVRESIRIKPEGCQILSVAVKKNFLDLELLDEQVKKFKDEYIKLFDVSKSYDDQLGIYASEKNMILANQTIGGKANGVEPEKLRATADFYRQRLLDILEKEKAINAEKAKLSKRLGELKVQIEESASKNLYPTSEVEVSINADKATAAQFDIEYYISEAGWFPAYDFRVNNLTSPLEIDYVAHIYQNSGLDWKNVEMTVSSADPGSNGSMPTFRTWYVSQQNYRLDYSAQNLAEINEVRGTILDRNGEPIPFATIAVENSSVGGVSDFNGKFNIALPAGSKNITVSSIGYVKQKLPIYSKEMNVVLVEEQNALQEVQIVSGVVADRDDKISIRGSRGYADIFIDGVKTRSESGKILESNVSTSSSAVSFEYTLKEKMNIPSDGRPYTTQIMKREILAEYKHFATPKLARDAYLNVFIPEWEKLNLLEGEVNLYFGNSYTGKSVVSLRNLKDSLEFSMGKDPNVKIQRTLTYQKTTGGGVLPNKTSEYRWSTEIRNAGTMPVKLTVTEPFPLSAEKEIKIELAKELSNAAINKEKGLLTWDVALQPGEQKKLEFGFSVIYPKNINMRFE